MYRLLVAALLCSTTAAMAEPVKLTDAKIRQTLAGSLLEIDTPLGTKIPVRFNTAGLMSGEAGALASYLGAAKDRGRWWTRQDHLCIKWFRWFQAEERCAEISRQGDKLFWRGTDGKTGTGTIAQSGEVQAAQHLAQNSKPAASVVRRHKAVAAFKHRIKPRTKAPAEVASADRTSKSPQTAGDSAVSPVASAPETASSQDTASAAGIPSSTTEQQAGAGTAPQNERAAAPSVIAAASPQITAPAGSPATSADAVPENAAAASPQGTVFATASAVEAAYIPDPVSRPSLTAARIAAARIAAPFATIPVKTVQVSASADEDSANSRFALAASFPSSLTLVSMRAEEAAQPEPASEPVSEPGPVAEAESQSDAQTQTQQAADTQPAPQKRDAKPGPLKTAALSSSVTRPTFRVAGVDPDDILNVRSGPSAYADVVGSISPEVRGVVIVGACRETWCPIEHDRVRGWVNSSYLAAENVTSAGSIR
jgi:hypothetical protein